MDEEMSESKCRLCGIHETKTYAMIHIFKPDNYVTKIHRVLPLSINEYDPLPKKMCYACHYKIVEFNSFVDKAIKTQEILKKELSWCQSKSDDNVVHSKPSAPLMEVIKDGAKNLNESSMKAPQLHQQIQKLSAVLHVDKEDNSNISGTDSRINKSCVNNITSSGSLNSKSCRNTISTSPVSNSSSGSSQKHHKSSPVVNGVDVQDYSEKDLSMSEDLKNKREKLLLTLKKSAESADTWSVPPTEGSKRKRPSDHLDHPTPKGNTSVKTIERDKNHKGVISKCVNNNNNSNHDSSVVKDSNLKEYNGQHPKRPHDSAGRNSGSSRSMSLSNNSVGSKQSVNNNNNNNNDNSQDKSAEIPNYLILTKIPMAGTVYTCIYCEQTFVSQSTACSHTCEKLLSMAYEQNCDSKNVADPPSYICEICNQNFSRHASLIAHQSVHEGGDNDSDRESCDENIIYFGQKKKKKTRMIRKVVTDEDGNYL